MFTIEENLFILERKGTINKLKKNLSCIIAMYIGAYANIPLLLLLPTCTAIIVILIIAAVLMLLTSLACLQMSLQSLSTSHYVHTCSTSTIACQSNLLNTTQHKHKSKFKKKITYQSLQLMDCKAQ